MNAVPLIRKYLYHSVYIADVFFDHQFRIGELVVFYLQQDPIPCIFCFSKHKICDIL